MKMTVPPTIKLISQFCKTLFIWLMYIKKIIGLRSLPGGTLKVFSTELDVLLLNTVRCVLSWRKLSNHRNSSPLMPKCINTFNNSCLEIVSKALLRSRNTAIVVFLQSKASFHFANTRLRARGANIRQCHATAT